MAPGDVPLFASFLLSEEGRSYQRWDFDTSVGPGDPPLGVVDPKLLSNAIYLTQVKIDAVGWAGIIPTIFEVKPQISLSGFGQLIAYRWYFQQHTGIWAQIECITDSLNKQYRILYEAHDIAVHIVAPGTQADVYQAIEIVKRQNGGQIRPVRLVWTEPVPDFA